MPGKQELPSTLERSTAKAQRTLIKAHDSAVEEYGEGQRAHGHDVFPQASQGDLRAAPKGIHEKPGQRLRDGRAQGFAEQGEATAEHDDLRV